MLLSLTNQAMLLLTASTGGLSVGLEGQPFYAGNTPVIPQDPSTFRLALIGAGVLAVYAAVRRRPLRFDPPRPIGRLSDQSEEVELTDGAQQKPSRGAA